MLHPYFIMQFVWRLEVCWGDHAWE